MAIYPQVLDSFSSPAGTSLLTSPDHANLHSTVGSAVVALETAVGTTNGTGVLKNFTAGDLAVRIQGGTVQDTNIAINGPTLGTPIMNKITSQSGQQIVALHALAPTIVTLSDSAGGTINTNAANGQVFSLTLGTAAGNRTIALPTNLNSDGQTLTYRMKTSGSANGTIVWASSFRFNDSGTPALGTAGTWNYFGWRYNSIDGKLDFQGASKQLI